MFSYIFHEHNGKVTTLLYILEHKRWSLISCCCCHCCCLKVYQTICAPFYVRSVTLCRIVIHKHRYPLFYVTSWRSRTNPSRCLFNESIAEKLKLWLKYEGRQLLVSGIITAVLEANLHQAVESLHRVQQRHRKKQGRHVKKSRSMLQFWETRRNFVTLSKPGFQARNICSV